MCACSSLGHRALPRSRGAQRAVISGSSQLRRRDCLVGGVIDLGWPWPVLSFTSVPR